ncbi:MAG: uridylate kinase [Parcubacteria bacterium C7867-008]|nr:MAG: uridylate kinase [Parcubacteria bacterium C7867-008]
MSLSRAKREYIVLSVGGSLIVPGEIDVEFLKSFRAFILDKVRRGFSFYIIIGGGHTARAYQHAGKEARGDLHPEDIDWLGIHATRMNAHLMRALFLDEAQARIVKNPSRKIIAKKPIIIGAGWKPGWSTDYCAVMAAKQLRAKRLINLSNIDHVYTADPRVDPTAQKIDRIDWESFRKLIPDHWDPGLSSPFDPIAAREAQELGIEVAVMNGRNLEAFDNYLSDKPFDGTVIY